MAGSRPDGIDVSYAQGNIDWQRVRVAGTEFAIIKTTEGGDLIDPSYGSGGTPAERIGRLKARFSAASKAGLIVGGYHFLRPRKGRTPEQEIDFAISVARQAGALRKGRIVFVLDVEASQLGRVQTAAYVWRAVRRVKKLTRRRPIIYTSPGLWQKFVLSVATGGCSLWVAHYGVRKPARVGGWRRWSIWQYTSTGRVAGVRGHVDRNVAISKAKLDALRY